jgi:glycogen debranching enzyme
MSYHNGSVWPHDTGIIALGLRRAGYAEEAITLVKALVDAASHFSDGRLPELFCGFERDKRFNSSPTSYVVSCSPQAWAAGCIFMLLQVVLDMRPSLDHGSVHLAPLLPDLFRRLTLTNLKVGSSRIGFQVENRAGRAEVHPSGSSRIQLDVVLP